MPDYSRTHTLTHTNEQMHTCVDTNIHETHTLFIDQRIVKESYDCELLQRDCFDENALPCPWKCGTAVDMVLQTW